MCDVEQAVTWAQPICSSSLQVATFLLVFWPFLLPLVTANLRLASLLALAFIQLPLHNPRSTKLLALGLVGPGFKSLGFLHSSFLRAMTFFLHPLALTVSFPPALLLTSPPVVVKVKPGQPTLRAETLTDSEDEAHDMSVNNESADDSDSSLIFGRGQIFQIRADAAKISSEKYRGPAQ